MTERVDGYSGQLSQGPVGMALAYRIGSGNVEFVLPGVYPYIASFLVSLSWRLFSFLPYAVT
jgi:hypothetical protein